MRNHLANKFKFMREMKYSGITAENIIYEKPFAAPLEWEMIWKKLGHIKWASSISKCAFCEFELGLMDQWRFSLYLDSLRVLMPFECGINLLFSSHNSMCLCIYELCALLCSRFSLFIII